MTHNCRHEEEVLMLLQHSNNSYIQWVTGHIGSLCSEIMQGDCGRLTLDDCYMNSATALSRVDLDLEHILETLGTKRQYTQSITEHRARTHLDLWAIYNSQSVYWNVLSSRRTKNQGEKNDGLE